MESMTKKLNAYHHGNLRQTLLDEALVLIEKKGVHALSLREVARAAGVSPGAPYHHFENRAALLAGIAIEGFSRFHKHLKAAKKTAKVGKELEEMGKAYALFAIENPNYFRVMFHSEIGPGNFSEVDEISDPIFEEVAAIIIESQAKGSVPKGDPHKYILLAWSAVHGIATLLVDGPLGKGFEHLDLDHDHLGTIVAETLNALFVTASETP